MKKFILSIFLGIFLLGCNSSTLKLNKKDELVFNYNSNIILLSNRALNHEFLNFKDLFVDQYKLIDQKNRILFYEEVTTSIEYELNFSALYTVMYVFNDAQEYEEIFRSNNLRLIQLKLKDNESVNIMIEANDTQAISYVYGFSNEEFAKLANSLAIEAKKEAKALKYKVEVLKKPLTNWNDRLVYFAPLLTPLRMTGGR